MDFQLYPLVDSAQARTWKRIRDQRKREGTERVPIEAKVRDLDDNDIAYRRWVQRCGVSPLDGERMRVPWQPSDSCNACDEASETDALWGLNRRGSRKSASSL